MPSKSPLGGSMTWKTTLGLIALALATAACGGGTAETSSTGAGAGPIADPGPVNSGPVIQSGDRMVAAEIGSAGGTLSLTNGSRVEIPRGALSETIEVHLSVGTQTQAFNNRDYEKPLGPTIHLQPTMQTSAPVVISIPVANIPREFTGGELTLAVEVAAAGQRAGVMGATQTTWSHVEARTENGRFVADLPDVPGMRLQFLVAEPE